MREPILKPLVFKIDWSGGELIVGKGEDFGVNLSNSASIVDQLPLICSLKLQANLHTPRPLKCNSPLLIQSESMFSLEINSQPLELQKVRTDLLTLITLRLSWSSSFLRIRLVTVTLVEGVLHSIAFPRSTIFSAICCGSSFHKLLVPTLSGNSFIACYTTQHAFDDLNLCDCYGNERRTNGIICEGDD